MKIQKVLKIENFKYILIPIFHIFVYKLLKIEKFTKFNLTVRDKQVDAVILGISLLVSSVFVYNKYRI